MSVPEGMPERVLFAAELHRRALALYDDIWPWRWHRWLKSWLAIRRDIKALRAANERTRRELAR